KKPEVRAGSFGPLAYWLRSIALTRRNVWALLRLGEHDLSVSSHTPPRPYGEGLDALSLHWVPVLPVVHQNSAVFSNLHYEDMALDHLSVGLSHLIDEKDSALSVNLDLSVDHLWNRDRDRAASGTFHDLIDELLGKRVEHN